MCQSLAEGGRRCAQHQAGSLAAKEIARLDLSLQKGQVDHLFKKLIEEGRGHPEPTQAEYARFIRAHKKKLNASVFQGRSTEAQRERIGGHLNRELQDSELPSGAAFYAMKKLHARSREQKLEFTTRAKAIARELGINLKSVREQFNSAYKDFQMGEGSEVENGTTFLDDKTVALLEAIRTETLNSSARTASVPRYSTEPRVRHVAIHRSAFINSVGWDEDDGRLEVNIRGSIYAYRNVPRDVYERLLTQAGRVFGSEIRSNPAYQYESREAAARDAFGRFCDDCHKYRAISGHVCDFSAAESRAREGLEALQEVSVEELNAEQKRKVEEAVSRLKARLGEVPPEPDYEDESAVLDKFSQKSEVVMPRKSARQRRWDVDVESREKVGLASSSQGVALHYDGVMDRISRSTSRVSSYYDNVLVYQSALADIKKTAYMDGKVAQHKVKIEAQPYYKTVTLDVDTWVEEGGEVKHSIRSLKCECDEYRRKYYCAHTVNPSNSFMQVVDSDFVERHGLDPQDTDLFRPGDERFDNGVYYMRTLIDHGEVNPMLPESAIEELKEDTEKGIQSNLLKLSKYINPSTNMRREDYATSVGSSDTQKSKMMLSPSGFLAPPLKPAAQEALMVALQSGRKAKVTVNVAPVDNLPAPASYYVFKKKLSAEVEVVDGELKVNLLETPHYRSDVGLSAERYEAFVTNYVTGDGAVHEAPNRSDNLATSEEWRALKEDSEVFARNATKRSQWESAVRASERHRGALDDVIEDYERRKNTAEGYTVSVEEAGRNGFSNNLDGYMDAVREARRSGAELPFKAEGGVTNGLCEHGSGVGFGLELEFDLPSSANNSEVGQKIAEDMQAAGLSDIDYQTGYHGYRGNRWHIERDSSVAGEVVSPILYDTPESWEEVRKVTEIIKRHGGTVSTRTGGHVHMGLPGGERSKSAVAQTVARYHDSIRRVQTSFSRGQHRNSGYASPASTETLGYVDRSISHYGNYDSGSNHYTDTNFGHRNRMEFRGFDASLDVAELQKNVAVAAGIVRVAEANREKVGRGTDYFVETHSEVGSNLKKLWAIGSSSGLPDSDDELIVADRDFRDFVDTILPGDWGRKVGAAIAAKVPWQEPAY